MKTARAHARRSRHVLAAVAGAATLAVMLAACTGSSASSSSTPGDTSAVKTLRIANGVAIDTLDPEQNSANESIWLDQNIYAKLVQTNPTGTKIVPDLADKWTISSDKLTYTFHIRSNAKFADGSKVTAEDAVWSIDRARALSGGWGFLLTAVKSITAPDSSTVKFVLSVPHTPLLADLAMYAYGILPSKTVKSDPSFFSKTPFGAGPFKVTQLADQTGATLTRNPYYWGPKPKISTVKISVVTNDNTRVLQLEAGDVDVIENPPGNLLKQIKANPKLNVDLFDSTRVDFLQVPLKTKPFENEKVRQAVAAALDLPAMGELAYQGASTTANTFFPYKMLYWDGSIPTPKQDLAKAKSLMSQAGYGSGFSTDFITVSGDTVGAAQAIAIKSDLAKIGITVTIQSFDQSTAYTKEDTGTNGLGLRYWTNDIIDPDEVATFGADGNGGANAFNSYWNDPSVNAMVEQARQLPDGSARAALYSKIQQAVVTAAPFIPLDYAPFRYASGKWVNGFHVSPLGNYNDSLLTLTVGTH